MDREILKEIENQFGFDEVTYCVKCLKNNHSLDMDVEDILGEMVIFYFWVADERSYIGYKDKYGFEIVASTEREDSVGSSILQSIVGIKNNE